MNRIIYRNRSNNSYILLLSDIVLLFLLFNEHQSISNNHNIETGWYKKVKPVIPTGFHFRSSFSDILYI